MELKEQMEKAAKKYIQLRHFEILDEDNLVYLDEDGDIHVCIICPDWDEDKANERRSEWEEKMLGLYETEVFEANSDCRVIPDLLMFKIIGESQAIIKHVVSFKFH